MFFEGAVINRERVAMAWVWYIKYSNLISENILPHGAEVDLCQTHIPNHSRASES